MKITLDNKEYNLLYEDFKIELDEYLSSLKNNDDDKFNKYLLNEINSDIIINDYLYTYNNIINLISAISWNEEIYSSNDYLEYANNYEIHFTSLGYKSNNIEQLADYLFLKSDNKLKVIASINIIIEYLNNKLSKKENTKPVEKLKINGSIQSIGYLLTQLFEKGYIDTPKNNSGPNISKTARMILDHFHYKDNDEQPNEEDIRKSLFSHNRLSSDKIGKFNIPNCKTINNN